VIKFLINVFARHSVPQVITTDNDVQFTSDMTKIFLDFYNVYMKFTSTYHPESRKALKAVVCSSVHINLTLLLVNLYKIFERKAKLGINFL